MSPTGPEINPLDEEDEYETEEQASERVALLRADGVDTGVRLPDDPNETIVEYGAFNQAEYFDPLFASGEIHEGLRHMVDDPLHSSGSLRTAARFADMRNAERARDDTMGRYGPVVVRTRTIVRTPWTEVSYEQLDRARGR